MSDKIYQVGIARTDITPPIGIRLCGYAVREGVSKEVHEPLSATALAIRAREVTILIVGLDLTLASIDYTQKVRAACAQAGGVAIGNVLVNYNHTHSAPNMPGWMPYDEPNQLELVETYGQRVIEQSAEGCKQ